MPESPEAEKGPWVDHAQRRIEAHLPTSTEFYRMSDRTWKCTHCEEVVGFDIVPADADALRAMARHLDFVHPEKKE